MAPYIDQESRWALQNGDPITTGELTYRLTQVCNRYLVRLMEMEEDGELRFGLIARVIAALEATKLEFYRRVVAPFEDQKLDLNGDVYDPSLRS